MATTTTTSTVIDSAKMHNPAHAEQHTKLVALIADGLGEKPFTGAYSEINTAVKVLGGRTVLLIAQEALHIHTSGGMKRRDGKGKRTLGGIFFHLLKRRCTPAQRRRIYPQAGRPRQANNKSK